MSTSIVRQLIAKDLFLMRPMIVGALVVGGIGIVLLNFGERSFFVGWIVLLIATVLHGVFTTAVGVVTERKDRVHLFVLTLPISPAQYLHAKLAASATAFFVPWALLLAAALITVAATGIPDGLMPFLAMLFGYVVCYYAAYFGMALVTDSVILSTLVIIIGNTAPVFLIQAFLRMSGVTADSAPPAAGWTGAVQGTLVGEFVFSAVVLCIAVLIRSRQRDHI
jgi:hypothetical protein